MMTDIASEYGATLGVGDPEKFTPKQWDNDGKPLLLLAPNKKLDRSQIKVEKELEGRAEKLLDPVRATLALNTLDEVQSALDLLEERGMVLVRAAKDRLNVALSSGYRGDVLLNFRNPNGVVGELQVGIRSMVRVKFENHDLYETTRSLEAQYGAATPTETWPLKDSLRYMEAVRRMRMAYSEAWEKDVKGDKRNVKKSEEKEIGEKEVLEMRERSKDPKYDQFHEYEGFYFKTKGGFPGVMEIAKEGKWVPYGGTNRFKIFMEGMPCTEKEALAASKKG
jgi:hypothetical protein